MKYLQDCPKCLGAGSEEFEHGLVQVGCSECNATGKIAKEIPETKPGQYFCVECKKAHKENSKLGISHLQFKAEESDVNSDSSGAR